MALGATSVEVSIKKIKSRNTKSDMEDMLNSVLILFLDFIAMIVYVKMLILKMQAHAKDP